MSNYLGDFMPGQIVRCPWNTFAAAGESITRATNGTMRVYRDLNTGNPDTGTGDFTDSEDVNSETGFHIASVDTSVDTNFYVPFADYYIVFNAMTVDGKVINACVGHFSILNRGSFVMRGQIASATSTTFVLNSTFADDIPQFALATIVHGAGKGQQRAITDWNSATDTGTVEPAWAVVPDATSHVLVTPLGLEALTSPDVAAAVWNALTQDYDSTGGGTFGNVLNIVEIYAASLANLVQLDVPTSSRASPSDVGSQIDDKLDDIADAVHDEIMEGSLTFRTIIKRAFPILIGKAFKSTGSGGDIINSFKALSDANINRVVVTIDTTNQRVDVAFDDS